MKWDRKKGGKEKGTNSEQLSTAYQKGIYTLQSEKSDNAAFSVCLPIIHTCMHAYTNASCPTRPGLKSTRVFRLSAMWLSARPSKHKREKLVVLVQNKHNLHRDPSPGSKEANTEIQGKLSEKNEMTLQDSMDDKELGESWRARKKGGGRETS